VTLCQGWKVALPDVRGTIRGAIATEDQVAQEILWEGTHKGPMETAGGTLPPSGAQISVEASLWLRFHGDKAREVHHYLDVLSLLQQIGAIPRLAGLTPTARGSGEPSGQGDRSAGRHAPAHQRAQGVGSISTQS
jgi:hypothetical protein